METQVLDQGASPARRDKVKSSLWDQVMKLSDIFLIGWSIVTYIFLYLPIVVLILFSFTKDKLGLKFVPWSLDPYRVLFKNKEIMDWGPILHFRPPTGAFPTSMSVAVLSTVIALIIGTTGAFALERHRFRGHDVWDGLNYTKIIVAEIVAGVSTLLFFVAAAEGAKGYFGFDLLGFLRPGYIAVVIAHVAWSIPFVVIIVRARLKGFDRSIEEAGADLGGRPTVVFVKVTFPAIAPGIMAAALLAFTLSFDDFVTTFFTSGSGMATLPVMIWSMIKRNVGPEINALSTFMMLFSMGIIIFLELKARISDDIA